MTKSSFVCLFQDKTEVRVFEVENAGDNEKIVEISTGPKGSKKYLTCFILILREFVGAEGGASMHQNNVAIHNKFEKYTQTQNTTQYQTIFPAKEHTVFITVAACVYDVQSFAHFIKERARSITKDSPIGIRIL